MGELMDFQVQETLVGLREALMIYLQHQNVRSIEVGLRDIVSLPGPSPALIKASRAISEISHGVWRG